MNVYFLMYFLGGLALLMAEFCSDAYEAGVRNGYDKGLEDGIRLTNKAALEEEKDLENHGGIDCAWRW